MQGITNISVILIDISGKDS